VTAPLTLAALALASLLSAPVAHAQAPAVEAPLRLTVPGEAWSLELPAPGFALRQYEAPAHGRHRYFLAVKSGSDVTVSAALDRIPQSTSALACRDFYWSQLQARSPLQMDDVRLTGSESDAGLEYVIHEVRGLRIEQKHINRYLARGGVCVDVHVSKIHYVEADEPALRDMLRAVQLVDRPNVPAGRERHRYAVAGDDLVTVEVPLAWEAAYARPASGAHPTIAVSSVGSAGTNFKMSFVPMPAGGLGADPPAALRYLTERTARVPLASAVETGLTLVELGGLPGYFYRLTDRAPGPSGYRYLIQGVAATEKVLVTFTVLSHFRDVPEIAEALAMVRSVRGE
jgi:hypothetical protein